MYFKVRNVNQSKGAGDGEGVGEGGNDDMDL